jgi:hypothetical protein
MGSRWRLNSERRKKSSQFAEKTASDSPKDAVRIRQALARLNICQIAEIIN